MVMAGGGRSSRHYRAGPRGESVRRIRVHSVESRQLSPTGDRELLRESRRSPCRTSAHVRTHLPPRRRHRRVRHAGRRRQGQGAEGGGRARHRLRRRRARLPHPRAHRRGRRRGVPRPQEPPLHAGRRPARAEGGHRRQDPPRLRATRSTAARCWSPTAASTPSTTPSRRCSTRATRCCCPRRTGPPTPSRSPLAGGDAGRDRRPTSHRVPGHASTSSRRPARRAPRRSCSCRRPTPPARCTRRAEVEAIGEWAVEHGIWVVTDEIYEHLTYGDHEFYVDADARARAGRPRASCSTAWPRPTP